MISGKKGVIIMLIVMVLMAVSVGVSVTINEVKASDDGSVMYRLYNSVTGEHLYTKDVEEKNWLMSNGWNYEGYSWIAANEGEPVYRLFNESSKEHHYTMNQSERDWLLKIGWNDEGIAWYSKKTEELCEVPVYRLFCPFTNEALKSHHYTIDIAERDWLISLGWENEGICWYSMHNINNGSVVPAVTKLVDRQGAINGICTIYRCKLCGEEVYRTGDEEVDSDFEKTWENWDDCYVLHLNKKHGMHYHTILDMEKGIVSEDEWNEELMEWCNDQIYSAERVPGYSEEVVVKPSHFHCGNCGKDIY